MLIKDHELTLRDCPVRYYGSGSLITQSPDTVESIWLTMEWERRPDAPREECWMNDYKLPYTYGSGDNARTYRGKQWNTICDHIRDHLNDYFGYKFDCCFVNGYRDGTDSLGYHADDSPEMDTNHPIAVVSFGAEREIWFRRKGQKGETPYGLTLEDRSVLIMESGMQLDWNHRIPKHPQECGPRISLTFRKLLRMK